MGGMAIVGVRTSPRALVLMEIVIIAANLDIWPNFVQAPGAARNGNQRGNPRFQGPRRYPQSNFAAPWGQGFGARRPMQLPPHDHYNCQPKARSFLALGTSAWEPNTNYHYP